MKSTKAMKKISLIMFALIAAASIAFVVSFALTPRVPAASAESVQTEAAADESGSEAAAEEKQTDEKGAKAIAAAIAVGLAAAAGAIGMGIAIAKSNESIARQPEAKNDIRSSMMLGLVFIETAIIYALIVAILVIFVL